MPISRLFANAEDAKAAVSDLDHAGFETVHLVTGDTSVPSLVKKGVSPAKAQHAAARIAEGAALVIVDAPFGTGAQATDILERARAGESDTPEIHHDIAGHDDAAPLSSALRMPLLSNDPAPLSKLLGMAVLSQHQSPKLKLSHKAAPFSSMLGLKTLTRTGAPLFGALSRNAAPLSSLLGLKLLSHNAAPLSSKAGMKTLSDNPAPLSSLLGLPVLSK